MRSRRALVLVVATLLVPGSAQVVAGNRRVGRLSLRTVLAVLAVVALLGALWLLDRSIVLGLLSRPWSLLLIMLLLAVLGVWWAYLFLDAWRLANPRRVRPGVGPAAGALAVVLAVVTAGPMLYGATLVAAQRDLISTVFGSGTTSEPVDGRYNVLLLGGDAGKGRVGVRPDSITLASIDADTGRTVLFALPRNLQEVPFPEGTPAAAALPDGFSCGDECLLNAVYAYGVDHPELFPGPDPGAVAMKEAVEGITGLRVNYYVLVELKGFTEVVNAMGGVEIDVKRRVAISGNGKPVTGWIEPGRQTLDGYHAMWFARSRHESSDYERMARQRCVMTAMATQMDPQTLVTRFQQIAAASQDLVATDIPDEDLGTLVDLGLKAKAQKITSVQFVPPLIAPADPDFQVVRTVVDEAVAQSREDSEDRDGEQEEARPTLPDGDDGDPGGGGEADDGSGRGAADPPAEDAAGEEPQSAAPVDARSVCSAG